MIRKLVRDITGQTVIKQKVQQLLISLQLAGGGVHVSTTEQMAQAFSGGNLQSAIRSNTIIFAFMWTFSNQWQWFIFQLLPLLAWCQLILRIRNFGEHGAVEFSQNPLNKIAPPKQAHQRGCFLHHTGSITIYSTNSLCMYSAETCPKQMTL